MPVDVSIVVGTRPEAIKCAPVIHALRERDVSTRAVATGQHGKLSSDALAAFDLQPDVNLECAGDGGLNELAARLLTALGLELSESRPRLVVVQGDTTSALAGALAAFHARIPCAHIEAGLRSGRLDAPWPEEMNRLVADRLSARHYAATEGARDNLLREGIAPESINVTGQTGVDACLWMTGKLGETPPGRLAELLPQGRIVYVTAHRRENQGGQIAELLRGVTGVLDTHKATAILAAHPNPEVQREIAKISHPQLLVTTPFNYAESVWMLKHADAIVTDSGGIQEEAPSFGTPVLVARDVTERPEGLEHGFLRLVGTDIENVSKALDETLADTSMRERLRKQPNPYGDGKAAARIADDITELLKQ